MLFPISFGSASLVFYGNSTICDGNSTICDSLKKNRVVRRCGNKYVSS